MMFSNANAKESVNGYSKNNGSFVAPYSRSNKDNSYNNNYSTKPNLNYYTGEFGKRAPTWNDKSPNRQNYNRSYSRSRKR